MTTGFNFLNKPNVPNFTQPTTFWPSNATTTGTPQTLFPTPAVTTPVLAVTNQQPVMFSQPQPVQQQQAQTFYTQPQVPQAQTFSFQSLPQQPQLVQQQAPAQTPFSFGQNVQQPQQNLQQQQDMNFLVQRISQIETYLSQMQIQQNACQQPLYPNQYNNMAVIGPNPTFPQTPIPVNSNTLTIPGFLPNGAPMTLQIPMGHASSFALMDGYRPISTPKGILIYPPSNSNPHPTTNNLASLFGYGGDDSPYKNSLRRASSSHSLYSLAPSRQHGSTCLADPYDRPYFLRPSTSPTLSSPSSTTILFDDRTNQDMKKRTLAWRRGYAGYYGIGSREADIIARNYENIVKNDYFNRRNYEKIYPSLETSQHRRWKKLDDSALKESVTDWSRRSRNSSENNDRGPFTLSAALKPRNKVTFMEPDHKHLFSSEFARRQSGPPTRSHLDDVDHGLYEALRRASDRRCPEVVGNLPGRFQSFKPATLPKSILKTNNSQTGPGIYARTSPVFRSGYKSIDASNSPFSRVEETPLKRHSSSSIIEVFRASNRHKGGFNEGRSKLRQIIEEDLHRDGSRHFVI